ncbi:hypothetical protein DRV85_16015 [Rhodosalinus halophilus]|uniref:Uncharacterized protein n=1 Tax=Rhodosalinus halophilus TaxID=2259333 RepID=A0A365U5K8_9RHOB|nr:hypothetical protein [Rhodosalinus halophilus]RBI83318.1 hypothetical protein DRV85_16015 [Rhodosalinus halophilus]
MAGFGSWAAYTMPVVLALDGPSGVMVADQPFCAAQVGREESALLRIIFGYGDGNIVQVGSPRWDFPRRRGRLTLEVGEGDAALRLILSDAHYAEAFAERVNDRSTAPQVAALFAAMASHPATTLTVRDAAGRPIARFPTNGMEEALGRAERCAAR